LQATPISDGAFGLPRIGAILGAGDRACEVLGVGATVELPMVSWGTTANVSVPSSSKLDELPTTAQVSRSLDDRFLVEAGLSAAGAGMDWVGTLTGRSVEDLLIEAARVEPGAGGLFAFPWLHGARAPWWRPEVGAAFIGLSTAHGRAELARSIVEGVAFDVARCLDLVAPGSEGLAPAGRGASDPLWRAVLSATTGLPLVRRALTESGSVGARLLLAMAKGESIGLEDVNPVIEVEQPDPGLTTGYEALRERSDRLATGVIGLTERPTGDDGTESARHLAGA
jgi:sugar (pentulose or hexulose) kinase